MTLATQDLEYTDDGTTLDGVVVLDEGRGDQRPGILLVHGGAGLDDHARGQAALPVFRQSPSRRKNAFGGFDCTQMGVCSRQLKAQESNWSQISGQGRRKRCLAMGVGL